MIPFLISVAMMFQQPVTTNSSGVPPSGMMLIEKTITLTTGASQLCNDSGGIARTCWIEALVVAVPAASAQTVVLQNTSGDFVLTNVNSSFSAGGAAVFYIPGGMKWVGGLTATAGANNSVNVYVRGWRQRGTNANP